jgi:hypothetical protein
LDKVELLKKYRNGDRLDDGELSVLKSDMKALSAIAYDYGDVFRLAAMYANRVMLDCSDFERNRKT